MTFYKIVLWITVLGYVGVAESSVRIEWTDRADNEAGFVIDRRLSTETKFTELSKLPTDSTYFVDDDSLSDKYCYRVGAFNKAGTNYSQEKCVDTLVLPITIPITLPNAPDDIRISVTITVKF